MKIIFAMLAVPVVGYVANTSLTGQISLKTLKLLNTPQTSTKS